MFECQHIDRLIMTTAAAFEIPIPESVDREMPSWSAWRCADPVVANDPNWTPLAA